MLFGYSVICYIQRLIQTRFTGVAPATQVRFQIIMILTTVRKILLICQFNQNSLNCFAFLKRYPQLLSIECCAPMFDLTLIIIGLQISQYVLHIRCHNFDNSLFIIYLWIELSFRTVAEFIIFKKLCTITYVIFDFV